MTDKLPPGSPCTMCGKCCTNASYMGTLSATGKDVKRWREEGRADILRFAAVFGPPHDPFADLWIDSKSDNDTERTRCPFVRKVPGSKRMRCSIYETRPQVCRDYVAWGPLTICEVVAE